jgi:hypothetical protein
MFRGHHRLMDGVRGGEVPGAVRIRAQHPRQESPAMVRFIVVEVVVVVEVETWAPAYGPVGSGDTSRTSAVITNVTLPDFATCAR